MNLKAININKSYIKEKHKINIIQDFSCDIESGELCLFRGASGSGKTTLLSILGLIDRPDCGELKFDNISVFSMKRHGIENLRRKKVGFVFQEANLLERLTVYENLILSQVGSGYKLSGETERINLLLKNVGLCNRKDHYPFELSGGEKQRVSFVRAILNKPKLLICDEPIANLDTENASIIKTMMVDMKKQGCIVLVSSHTDDFDEIADNVIEIRRE